MKNERTKPRLLLVEPDQKIRDKIRGMFSKNLEIVEFGNVAETLTGTTPLDEFEIVITEIRFPRMTHMKEENDVRILENFSEISNKVIIFTSIENMRSFGFTKFLKKTEAMWIIAKDSSPSDPFKLIYWAVMEILGKSVMEKWK